MKCLFCGGDQSGQACALLLGSRCCWVYPDRSVDAFVGLAIVVLPDRYDAVVVRLPSPYQPGAVAELDRQQVFTEELVECRQVLRHGAVDAHAGKARHCRRVFPVGAVEGWLVGGPEVGLRAL